MATQKCVGASHPWRKNASRRRIRSVRRTPDLNGGPRPLSRVSPAWIPTVSWTIQHEVNGRWLSPRYRTPLQPPPSGSVQTLREAGMPKEPESRRNPGEPDGGVLRRRATAPGKRRRGVAVVRSAVTDHRPTVARRRPQKYRTNPRGAEKLEIPDRESADDEKRSRRMLPVRSAAAPCGRRCGRPRAARRRGRGCGRRCRTRCRARAW
jgi:hypothetical protein